MEGGAADQAKTAAVQEECGPDPRPATPPGGREETLRLLDQLLAESEVWGPQEQTPRGPARLPPAVSMGGWSLHSSFCTHPGLGVSVPRSPRSLPPLVPYRALCPFLIPTPAWGCSLLSLFRGDLQRQS